MAGDNDTFEFGETEQSNAFFKRNPKFVPAVVRLVAVSNKCFGREIHPKNRLEDVAFGLGHACRQDFIEIMFLAVNGYATGGMKLLRGLFERSVALAYMIRNPEKAERFVRYAAIQEHRALEAALRVVSEEAYDEAMKPTTSASQIRRFYQQFKGEFQITDCKKCGTTRTQSTWDLDVAAMTQKVGDPYDKLFLVAYTIPNFDIHATLASAFDTETRSERTTDDSSKANLVLLTATTLLILVLREQSELFSLNLAREIDECERDLADVWDVPTTGQSGPAA